MSAEPRQPSARGRAVLAIDWWPRELPEDVDATPVTLVTHDGDVSRAVLYQRGTADTVVALMHPRQDLQRAWQVLELLDAGYAVWAQNSRDVGNDLRLVHESTLLDVAAGMEWLRERGFAKIVLLGVSGGASLYSYYTEQALLAPAARLAREPAGRATALQEATMPAPDALALLAPHPGQGRLLLGMIDPSVTDEADPLSIDAELDAYDEANGFGLPPEGSRYAPEFVSRYRAAQEARVRHIDDRAREIIAGQRAGRAGWKDDRSVAGLRRSLATPVLTTYRTDADPRCTDLSLDPSDRAYGSIMSPRPYASNYGIVGFGRLTTPEAWLSTWSGVSSQASLLRAAPGISIPTLVIEYTGDQSVFPSDVREAVEAIGAADKAHLRVRGDHFGRALSEGEESGGSVAMRELVSWIDARG